MRQAPKGGDGLGLFREIFYQWALAMRSKFDLLVLPHHTQVVCLLAFRRFLEVHIHIYIYIYIHMYIVYIYIYIYTAIAIN